MIELLNVILKNVLGNEEYTIFNDENLYILDTNKSNFQFLKKNNFQLVRSIETFVNIVKNENIILELKEN